MGHYAAGWGGPDMKAVYRFARIVWKSNAVVFFVSVAGGFFVGSGCVLSGDRTMSAPRDFSLQITEMTVSPAGGGRFAVDHSGIVEYDDWTSVRSGQATYRESWEPARVDSLYAFLLDNGIRTLDRSYPDLSGSDATIGGRMINIEARMRGTDRAVFVAMDLVDEIPSNLANIIDWFGYQAGAARARAAKAAGQ